LVHMRQRRLRVREACRSPSSGAWARLTPALAAERPEHVSGAQLVVIDAGCDLCGRQTSANAS
jgi:hypothetical protein